MSGALFFTLALRFDIRYTLRMTELRFEPKGPPRPLILNLRLSENERKRLDRAAKRAKVPTSVYARAAIVQAVDDALNA